MQYVNVPNGGMGPGFAAIGRCENASMCPRPYRAAASSSCQIASMSSMLGAMRCIWELS